MIYQTAMPLINKRRCFLMNCRMNTFNQNPFVDLFPLFALLNRSNGCGCSDCDCDDDCGCGSDRSSNRSSRSNGCSCGCNCD